MLALGAGDAGAPTDAAPVGAGDTPSAFAVAVAAVVAGVADSGFVSVADSTLAVAAFAPPPLKSVAYQPVPLS